MDPSGESFSGTHAGWDCIREAFLDEKWPQWCKAIQRGGGMSRIEYF